VHYRYQRHWWQICCWCQLHRYKIFHRGINDTSGKFSTGIAGVVDIGGKFATGCNGISANLPLASTTPVSTTPAVNVG
jgi:hypothetical protein